MGDGFELLDHTSEVGFRAHGATLAAAFENAGRALFQVMTDIDELGDDVDVEIDVAAESREALLFDFIDELIYLAETERVVLGAFDLSVAGEDERWTVEGTGRGERIHEGMRLQDVKAPTYSDMRVEEHGDGWVLEMTLDV